MLAKDTTKNPSEDHVHDLRVILRRLRSLANVMNLKSKTKEMKKLTDKLGELRDLDVAIRNADNYKIDGSNLRKKQLGQRPRIQKHLTSQKSQRVNQEISSLISELQTSQRSFAREVKTLRKLLKKWKHRPLTGKNLHNFRITIKKARYFLEVLGQENEDLRNLQNSLGEIHDLEVLINLTGPSNKVNKKIHKKSKKVKKCYKHIIQKILPQLHPAQSGTG